MKLKTLFLALALTLGAFGQQFPHTKTITIAESASLSDALVVREGVHPQGSCTPTAIIMPAEWDAASITVQVSVDGVAYQDLYDNQGSEITITAAAARTIRLDAADFWGSGLLFKFRSGTSGTPVTQTAARTLKIVCR